MPGRLTHEQYIEWVERSTAAFAEAASATPLHLPVASCPGWDVEALIRHLGHTHAWARTAIVEGYSESSPFEPPPGADLVEWYRAQARSLLAALRDTPPDADVWSFDRPPHRVAFWSRRQAHETVVHVWDIVTASGSPDGDIDPELAADGVDEVLTVFYPRQVRLGRIDPITDSVMLESSDAEEHWVLGPGTAGEQADPSPPEVVVRGSAPDLLLLLWKRRALDDACFSVAGDLAAAQRVLAHKLTP